MTILFKKKTHSPCDVKTKKLILISFLNFINDQVAEKYTFCSFKYWMPWNCEFGLNSSSIKWHPFCLSVGKLYFFFFFFRPWFWFLVSVFPAWFVFLPVDMEKCCKLCAVDLINTFLLTCYYYFLTIEKRSG